MEWLVQLEGDEWSLEDLPRWFSQLDHKVKCEEGRYYLTSSAFNRCAKSTEVWNLAEQIVEQINCAAKAFQPSFRPVQVGSEVMQIDEDGTRPVHQRIRPGLGKARAKGYPAVVSVDGKPPPPEPSKPEKLVALWETEDYDSAAARALRVWLLPQQTWSSLYHIHEIIKDDMSGGRGRCKNAWKALLPLMPAGTTESELNDQLNRFRDTANDYRHSGVLSRHGAADRPPIADPISWADAEGFIHRLLVAWLSQKI